MQEMPESNEVKIENKVPFYKNINFWLIITIILITIFGVLSDQITKISAENNLTIGQSIPFLGDTFLVFTLTYNTGGAWGLGGDQTWSRILLILVSWVVAIGIIVYFIYSFVKKKINKALIIIFSFVLSGDIGNLIDRTFFYNRGVIDFLDISRWWKNFGIFNVADSILVCSLFALIIYYIYSFISEEIKKNKKAKEKVENEDKL